MSGGVNFFDPASAARIGSYVKRREAWRPGSPAGRGRPARKTELVAFRVVSDLSQEAIDDATAVHGSEVTADFLGDVTTDFSDLGNGCVAPGGQSCAGIVPCFPCDLTITIRDTEGVAGTAGDVLTFVWSGTFNVSTIINSCTWLYETRYVGTSANAAGFVVTLSNMMFGFTCPYMSIRDTLRFGDSDPGFGGSYQSYTLRTDPSCDLMTFRAGGVDSVSGWGLPANRPIYTAAFTCTEQQITDGETMLAAMLPQCVIDQIIAAQTADVGDWTVNLDLFGGVPEPGSILHAKNVGGTWYAMGARHLRIMGDLAAETLPDRIEVDGCLRRQVPFVYMVDAMGDDVPADALHFCTWHRQTRRYIATRWEGC